MAHPQVNVHVSDIQGAFSLYDTNSDGNITRDELNKVMRCFKPDLSDEEVDRIFEVVDKDQNGSIDFPEFLKMMDTMEPDTLTAAFDLFDQDGDGQITEDEIVVALASLGEAVTEDQVKQIMQEVDIDGDGTISYAEFSQVSI